MELPGGAFWFKGMMEMRDQRPATTITITTPMIIRIMGHMDITITHTNMMIIMIMCMAETMPRSWP